MDLLSLSKNDWKKFKFSNTVKSEKKDRSFEDTKAISLKLKLLRSKILPEVQSTKP